MREKTMIDDYRDFARVIIESSESGDDELPNYCVNRAKELLEKDFKEQVIRLFGNRFQKGNWYDEKENREKIKSITKKKFVTEFSFMEEENDFIEENWDEIDKIISILKDYAKKLEEEESKE